MNCPCHVLSAVLVLLCTLCPQVLPAACAAHKTNQLATIFPPPAKAATSPH
eukprot:m.214595 g.214595  ORF g.214595 m.214595 type:complete len:51 (+) comp54060_c0_seq1:89-241(+)